MAKVLILVLTKLPSIYMFDCVIEGSKLRYGAFLCGLFDIIFSFRFLFLAIKYRLQIHDAIYLNIYTNSAVKNWKLLSAYINVQHAAGIIYGGFILLMLPAFIFGIAQGRELFLLFWLICGITKCIMFLICVSVLCIIYNQTFNLAVDWPFLDFSYVLILVFQCIAMQKFYWELKSSTSSRYRSSQLCPSCV